MRTVDAIFLLDLVDHYRGRRGLAQRMIISKVGRYLPVALVVYKIDTPLRQAHFLAQACQETFGLSTLEEESSGSQYEGRNGNATIGDGARYKGRGLLQLTGKTNYERTGKELNRDLAGHPDLVETDTQVAVDTACRYWTDHHLNTLADRDDFMNITIRINGHHPNGVAERRRYLRRAKEMLGVGDAVGIGGSIGTSGWFGV